MREAEANSLEEAMHETHASAKSPEDEDETYDANGMLPGQVDIDSPVLKADLANLIAALEARGGRMPLRVNEALRDAKTMMDHVDALDRILSALEECKGLPTKVAEVFGTTCVHFGLPDWARRFQSRHGEDPEGDAPTSPLCFTCGQRVAWPISVFTRICRTCEGHFPGARRHKWNDDGDCARCGLRGKRAAYYYAGYFRERSPLLTPCLTMEDLVAQGLATPEQVREVLASAPNLP